MILKPTTFLAGTFFVSFTAFSQFTHSLNLVNSLNPAMAGLDYKSSGNLILTASRSSQEVSSAAFGNYSGFLSKYNIGFGISSINRNNAIQSFFAGSNKLTKLSVNKQFLLKNNLTFSTGLGLGINTQSIYYTLGPNSQSFFQRSNAIGLDVGAVLKGERFKLGIDGGYQFPVGNSNNSQIILNLFASYTFGKEDGLQFTPHALLSQIGPSIGGTFTYKSKYILGGGLAANYFGYNRFRPYVTAGYTINDKFKINYTYNFLNNGPPIKARHELTLGFQLGKK